MPSFWDRINYCVDKLIFRLQHTFIAKPEWIPYLIDWLNVFFFGRYEAINICWHNLEAESCSIWKNSNHCIIYCKDQSRFAIYFYGMRLKRGDWLFQMDLHFCNRFTEYGINISWSIKECFRNINLKNFMQISNKICIFFWLSK